MDFTPALLTLILFDDISTIIEGDMLMKFKIIILMMLVLSGCTVNSNDNYVKQGEQKIPKDIYNTAESIKDELSSESDLDFIILGTEINNDIDVGKVYGIWYGVVPDSTIQFRLLFDYNEHSLSAICIIMAENDKRDDSNKIAIFNNKLKPAFLTLDIKHLFHNQKYKRAPRSDDEIGTNETLYLEYILDKS